MSVLSWGSTSHGYSGYLQGRSTRKRSANGYCRRALRARVHRDAPAAGVASASRWEEKTDGRRPWLVEETETTFIVRTANRLVVSLIYFDNEPRRRSFNLTKDEARRVARSIARLPDLLSPRE